MNAFRLPIEPATVLAATFDFAARGGVPADAPVTHG